MKLVNRLAVPLFVGMLGAGCVQKSAPTVEYFRAHPEERVAQLARCANDPGSLKDTPDCVNAQQAADLERDNSLRDLPSMGLPKEAPPGPVAEDRPKRAQ